MTTSIPVLMLSGFLWALPTLLPAADLVMVEEPGCPWCARWTAEIGPIYPKTAEGRADKEPIADNATREGRAANRRIEVLLVQETDG